MRGTVWKKGKRMLALILAAVVLAGSIPDTGFAISAKAAGSENAGTEAEMALTLSAESAVYTGENVMPSVTVKSGTQNVTSEAVITWSAKGSADKLTEIKNAGVYTCTASWKQSGQAEADVKTAEFTVLPKALTETMAGDVADVVYDGNAKRPVVVIDTDQSRILHENTDYTISYRDNLNVGNAEAVITGMGNYTGTITKGFTILPQQMADAQISLAKSTGTYRVSGQNIEVRAPFSAYELTYYKNTVSEANQVSEIIDAGNYKVRVKSLDANYEGTKDLDYRVVPKDIADRSIQITYDKESPLIYHGKEQKPQVTSVKDGNTELAKGADQDYTVTYGSGNFKDRGSYTVTVNGKGNYTGTAEKTFVIQTGSAAVQASDFIIEGQGYKKGYYRSDVKVKVKGYQLSEKENDDAGYTEFLSYSETLKQDQNIYLKDEKTGEVSGPVVLKKDQFQIIKQKPEVWAAVEETTPETSWTKEKTIRIEEPQKDVDYYYADTLQAIIAVNTDGDLDGLTKIKDGTFSIQKDIGEQAESYYVYAVDPAGNLTNTIVSVKMIDTVAPEIQILKNHAHYDTEQDVFWKNGEDLTILLTTGDDRSGVAAVTVTPAEQASVSADKQQITFRSAGDYTITVSDQAGNDTSVTVTVRQDTGTPSIRLQNPQTDAAGEALCHYFDGEICWISKDSVRLPFEVTDTPDADAQRAGTRIAYSTDAGANWTALDDTQMADGYVVFEHLRDEAETYVFRVSDLAGNVSDINAAGASMKLAADLVSPAVDAASFVSENEKGWINAEDLGTDGTIEISVEAKEEGNASGVGEIFYVFDREAGKTGADYQEEDFQKAGNVVKNPETGALQFCTAEDFSQAGYADGTYYWIIRVADQVGNTTDYPMQCKLDKTAPEETAYARFISDTEGVNRSEMLEENGSWGSRILSFMSDGWNQICGKKTVQFELYLKDLESGISDAELTYQADGTQVEDLRVSNGNLAVVDGLKVFQEGEFSAEDAAEGEEGYTVVTGSMTIGAKEDLAISGFTLNSVTDKAGNRRENYSLQEGGYVVYLDSVAPELTAVTVDESSVAAGGPFYYNAAKKVKFEINERFFAEAVEHDAAPVFTIYSRNDASAEFAVHTELTAAANAGKWTVTEDVAKSDSGTYANTKEIELPVVQGEDTEYQIRMRFCDPSGNPLVNGDGISGVADGEYQSQTFVMSGCNPTLDSFTIAGVTDRQVDGVNVYHMGADGAGDVTLGFSIRENAAYWTEEVLAEKMRFVIYRLTAEGEVPVVELGGDALLWTEDGNLHQASYAFGGEDEPAAYRAEIVYENRFGQTMQLSDAFDDGTGKPESDGAQGSYQSVSFILDHKKPVYGVSYNEAYRLVKDGEGNTGAAQDEMHTAPMTGYTAYYNDQIEVSFTVAEDYAVASKTGALNEDFELRIMRDGSELAALPEIRWSSAQGVYTGNFVLEEEGTYEITMKYRDAAGNPMMAGADVAGSKTSTLVSAEGIYTSTVLVLDKTAPKITVDYVNKDSAKLEPVLTVGERKYFDEDVYLQIRVEDKNIRYSEMKDALLDTDGNLQVYDICGDKIAENPVAAFLNGSDFEADRVSHDGAVWNIPLFSETDDAYGANYELILGYEDLAGNGGEDNQVRAYPVFDKTMPEEDVYLCVTSDVKGSNSSSAELMESADQGWVSKVLRFLSDAWLKMFGRERITFKLYLKDRITGVDAVSMQYEKEDGSTVSFDTAGSKTAEAEVKIVQSEAERKDADLLAGYMALEGSITVPSGESAAIDKFSITEIKDKAGNIRTADDDGNSYVLHDINGETNLLYLDCTNPVLNIDYTDKSVTDEENGENRIFYKEEAELSYMLEDHFFADNTDNGREDGNPIEPEVVINGEQGRTAEVSAWTPVTGQKYDALASIRFLGAADTETAYQYTVSYRDAAENPLTAGDSCKGTAENGVYTDYTIIVDRLAPKLTAFAIEGTTDRTVDGAPVYHNDGNDAQNDVTVAFTVDDHASYWNPKELLFEIYDASSQKAAPCVCVSGSDLTWEDNGRSHSTTYGFDGENNTPAAYYVKISYADRAGNPMILGGAEEGKVQNGCYTSGRFILDHAAPVFNIRYNYAHRVVNNDGTVVKDSEIKTPQTGYTSYYKNQIDVTFSITEHYATAEGDKIVNQKPEKDFIVTVTKDQVPLEEEDMPQITWSRMLEGDVPVYQGKFTLKEDGRYQIAVSYRDAAMNRMEAGNTVQGSNGILPVTENGAYGTYTSTMLVLDTHAPEVHISYADMASKKEAAPKNVYEETGRNYFDKPVYLQIHVDDTVNGTAGSGNVRYQELKQAIKLTAQSGDGKLLKNTKAHAAIQAMNPEKTANDAFVVELPLTDEANYNLSLSGFEDLAGNKVRIISEKACMDRTQPEVTLSSKLVDRTGYSDMVTYGKRNIWFANGILHVTAAVSDATAGVKEIKFTVRDTDDDGKTLYRTATYNPPETMRWQNKQTFTVSIPLETTDFTGTVTAEVTDWSNCTGKTEQEVLVESKKRHKQTSSAEIKTKTKPSRIVNGIPYYNTDVKLAVIMKDSYSGIREYEITPGKDQTVSQNFAKEKNNGIRYSYQKNVTLSSRKNNANDVKVTAEHIDNTNHKTTVSQKYHIDITAPKIEVTYNLNDPASEKYYKNTRVATVAITERNFDPKDVKFTITNTDGTQPSISSWTTSGTGDAAKHTCTITYSADGDYTFAVAFQDKAGNKASYNRVDEFTIDQTAPSYTVVYDNDRAENGYYYKEDRTATIDIVEHNFDPSAIKVAVTRNGAAADAQLSGWSRNGDHNTATVPFHEDGEYTFQISGMDFAQNEMEPYQGDRFVVDKTAPELEIQNIAHMSANNGVVAPRIVYHDTNYDASRTKIIYEGAHNGKIDYSENGTTSQSDKGAVIAMNDVERKPENDDIYTMRVTVYDKAGNASEAEKIFSVNRFGSVYTFDDAKTEALVGDERLGYTNTAQDICISETNVDSLDEKEITCNRDGQMVPMKEGVHYKVTESGSDVTWKQYQYTIYKDSFEEEGHYIIKLLSKDRATNLSDNDTKGKKIEFIMDTTSPSALISGVENNGRYQTNSQEVIVDVEDNVLLGNVQLYVNDKLAAEYTDMKELMELNGMIHYDVEEQNYAQSFKVVATDAAGNTYTEEITNFTVNANWWRLLLANRPLLYGLLILLLLLAGFFWILILGRKKKKEQEAQQ